MNKKETIKNIEEMLKYNKEQLKLCEEFEDYPVNEEIEIINKNIETYKSVLRLIEESNK